MEIHKGEIPFVRILIPFATGIGTTLMYKPSDDITAILSYFLAFLILSLACYLFFYRWHYNYHYRWVPGIITGVIIFLFGYTLTASKNQLLNNGHFSKAEVELLVVTISSEPKLSGNILRFESNVNQGYKKRQFFPLDGKLLVALKTGNGKNYNYGDRLLIPSTYTEIEAPYNPAEFNYKAYLADHGITHQTFVDTDQVYLLGQNKGNPVLAYAFQLREDLILKFNKYIADRNNSAVASTLILGYRADLSKEILNAYSKTGTMHVLSVSGMHVGIVFIVMVFLLKFMDRSRKLQLLRAVLIISLIWFYAILTGFSPAACRAALMLSFVILGKAINRNQNTYNLLASSAVLLLISNPLFMFDVGFQLSYIAVIGLVFVYPKLYHLFYIRNWVGDKIWSYIALSTAAQLATFPLSIYYFHQFPVYFLLSNLFIVLPVTLIMYAGLLFLFVPWDIFLLPLGQLLNYSIGITNHGLLYIENLPLANFNALWITPWTYMLIYGFLFFTVFALMYRSKPLLYAALSALLILALTWAYGTVNFYKQPQIIFYSLRKNSAIGFFENRKAIILTDLKPEEKTFSYSINPSLESNRIQSHKLLQPGEKLSTRNFYYARNFIQFRGWKLLIWDKNFENKSFAEPIHVDVLLLRGNPRVSLKELKKAAFFRTLIIDASNSDFRIKNWRNQALEAGIAVYITKKNAAYIVAL